MLTHDRDATRILLGSFNSVPDCGPVITTARLYGEVDRAVIHLSHGRQSLIIPGANDFVADGTVPGSLILHGPSEGSKRGLFLGIYGFASVNDLCRAVDMGVRPYVGIDAGFTRPEIYGQTLDPIISGDNRPGTITPEYAWALKVQEKYQELQADLSRRRIEASLRAVVLHKEELKREMEAIPSGDSKLVDSVIAWASSL